MSGNSNPNEQTDATRDSPSEGQSARTSPLQGNVQVTDVIRQRIPLPSGTLSSEDNSNENLETQAEMASVRARLVSLIRQQRELDARHRESVARHREAAARQREVASRHMEEYARLSQAVSRRREADVRDPITYTSDRVRMTSRNMRNQFPRTRLDSVGDEPYSDEENY